VHNYTNNYIYITISQSDDNVGTSCYLQAGLCSQETCGYLQEASALSVPNETNPDKLSLALEPECAALYCQSMQPKQQVASDCQAEMCYLVVDIGGGTVDISVHRVRSIPCQHVEVVHPPTGNKCGGSRVNQEFKKYLESIVNDKGFAKYLKTNNPMTNADHSAALNELVNKTFEVQKIMFGDRAGVGAQPNAKFAIRLPHSFYRTYRKSIDKHIKQLKGKDSRLKRDGPDLRIDYSLMGIFFQPVVSQLLQCISQTLKDVEPLKVDTIYLVGGLGGSNYIYEMIKEEFGSNYKYFRPTEYNFAVVHGAVLFRQHPDIVHARRADATYGVGTIIPFDPLRHDPEYKWINDDGREQCLNIFCTVVENGDLVCTNEVFTKVFVPAVHNQKETTFIIYSTLEKDVWYTIGKREEGKSGTAPIMIGEINVQMSDLTGDKNRNINLTFDFSHTEIQVKGYDCTSQEKVKVALDFLSAL